jgi:hypothetical protein
MWQILLCHMSQSKTIQNGWCGFNLFYQFDVFQNSIILPHGKCQLGRINLKTINNG